MCLSKDIVGALCFGLAALLPTLLLLAKKEVRAHLDFSLAVWSRIVGKALLFTVPAAGTINLVQDWLETTAQVCVGRIAILLVAFALVMLFILVGVGAKQVQLTSGINLSQRFRGTYMLLFLTFAVAFLVIRHALGLL